ncbi:MAG TPA: flagellar hook-associated protein FlgK [Sedimentisphaerales bacterium]|nr:flagellar hook-associated protein FlgK [Sedimentisphaerales bacterium]
MDGMSIAIGAMRAAQTGLNVAGNNIANAATEGYHRQRVEFTPAYSSEINGFLVGGGVNTTDITRIIDTVLGKQLTRQYSLAGQARTELHTLSSVEAAFGELGAGGGLSTAIDDFFNSLSSLAADPGAGHLQIQAVRTAELMSTQFRTLGTFLSDLSVSMTEKAYSTVKQINEYAEQIAQLNYQIRNISIQGGSTNNLMDQRDARINNLAELVGISVVDRENGVADVNFEGTWLVVGSEAQRMDVSTQAGGLLGIAPVGITSYMTEVSGGTLGAYFSLNNTALANIRRQLDTLAESVISGVNGYHVQGLGANGSFTELVSISTTTEALSDLRPPVTDGRISIRVTNAAGEVRRTDVDVNVSTDTLTTMAAKLDAVEGISARVELGRLVISGDAGCTFDFLADTVENSDTSGFLAAAGMNTFFSGSNARNIAVSGFISANPRNIASCLGAELTDNANVLRLSRMSAAEIPGLGGISIGEYYRQMVTDIGTDISLKQMRVDNIEIVTHDLEAQREQISGVNVNDEAAKLLIFERMFQASARYLNTIHSTMQELMRLL